MHYMIIAIMMAVIAVIGMMLQRVFQGPTVYDRMNGCLLYTSRCV